jgi:hypothetical protein
MTTTATVMDSIEPDANGNVMFRLRKDVLDDKGAVVSSGFHRSAIGPTTDIADQVAAVNAHLATMGYPPISGEDVAAIEACAVSARTPEAIAAVLAVEKAMEAEHAAKVPISVSDRQLAHALALSGIISHDEAKAWVKVGDLPAALQAVVAGVENAAQRFNIEMLLEGATTFERYHPATSQLAAAMGWSDQKVDELWRLASSL